MIGVEALLATSGAASRQIARSRLGTGAAGGVELTECAGAWIRRIERSRSAKYIPAELCIDVAARCVVSHGRQREVA